MREAESRKPTEAADSISMLAKCGPLAAAWGTTAVIMLLLSFPFWLMMPRILFYFPTGPLRLLGWGLGEVYRFAWLAWLLYLILTLGALSMPKRGLYKIVFLSLCVLLLANIVGCRIMITEANPRKQAEKRIEATRKQLSASSVRELVLPLFASYHHDQSKPDWGPPNYVTLNLVPKGIASLPLFTGLQPEEEIPIGALSEDTNALIVFTQRATDKWGVVVHRSENRRELPWIGGQEFCLWDKGVFFYLGSNFPD